MTRLALLLVTVLVIISSTLSSSKKDKETKEEGHTHHEKKHKKHNNTNLGNDEPDEIPDDGWDFENTTAVDNRRILFSKRTEKAKRPYMPEGPRSCQFRITGWTGWGSGPTRNPELTGQEWTMDQWSMLNQSTCPKNARLGTMPKQPPRPNEPYMTIATLATPVYLQLTKESAKAHKYRGWLCGGVIVDQYYVLTSAACVEDADKFYIVSGTTKFIDSFDYKNDECVCKHRRKVVWKCIPKNYKFDFQDSIKWSSNDIAIVKVDRAFKFAVQEKGCEFGTCPITYNNISRELEKPGTKGWIAGWGSGNNFREGVYRRQKEVHIPKNAKCLQEAKVCVMDNEACAKKWAQRFREIITQYMICTRDVMKRLSEQCDKRYANCTDVESRRQENIERPTNMINIDLGRHLRDPDDYTARRSSMQGGFCENDHGGPLIVRHKNKETVIGVISACKIDPKTHSCHGPFLYTSVYRNRQFISCAIHKDVESDCRRVFRSGITHEEWTVSWDGEDEDVDDDDKTSSNKAASKSSESDESSKEVLRQSEQTTTPKKEKKSKKAKKEESSSESEDEVVTTTTEKPEKVEEKPQFEVTTEKHKKKSKSKKHKAKTEEKVEKVKKSKESSEETSTQTTATTNPASYESSNDENVNNPDSE